MTASPAQPTPDLEPVDVLVGCSLVPSEPPSGRMGRIQMSAWLLPEPSHRRDGFGISGTELRMTFTPEEAERIHAARTEERTLFVLPAHRELAFVITRQEPSGDGRAVHLFARRAGPNETDRVIRARQVQRDAAYNEQKRKSVDAAARAHAAAERRKAVTDALATLTTLSPDARAEIEAAELALVDSELAETDAASQEAERQAAEVARLRHEVEVAEAEISLTRLEAEIAHATKSELADVGTSS